MYNVKKLISTQDVIPFISIRVFISLPEWDEQIYAVHGEEVLGLFHSISAETSIQKILLVIQLQSFRVTTAQTTM